MTGYHWSDENIWFSGPIQIEYDVGRPELPGGDILIRNGYFVHFISPEKIKAIRKNIIFILDKSGSMKGDRLNDTQRAFEEIFRDLE